MNKEAGLTLLDAGCGQGILLENFTKRGNVFVIGIDISLKMLKIAKRRSYEVIQCDLNYLPFRNKTFDIIVASEVLEHFIDVRSLLRVFYDLLRIRGTLICTCPNINTPSAYFYMLLYDLPPEHSAYYMSPHYRDFTLKTLKIALKLNGFTPIKWEGIFFTTKFLFKLLYRYFPRFAPHILIVAKKTHKPLKTPKIFGGVLIFRDIMVELDKNKD
jgi:ubiquinone/menaquinone biosynthesis C-methylase UbiE